MTQKFFFVLHQISELFLGTPGKVSECYASVFDNMYTNATNATMRCGNILMQIKDHFPQFFVLKNAQINHNKLESFKYDYNI